MKSAKIAVAVITVLCAVSLIPSCKRVNAEWEAPVKEQDTTVFTVGLNTVEAEYAEVVVRHTGAKNAAWFGFLTDDVTSPAQDLVNAQLSQLNKDALHVGNVQTVALRNLQEYVSYRYIAFAVNESNQLEAKSKVGSLTFNTSPKFDVTFSAECTEVQPYQASFNVGHTGIDVLTYVGFVTENLTDDVAALAAQDYDSKVRDGRLKEGVELLSGTAQTVTMTELKHETAYRFIVYGLYEEAKTAVFYGTPADCPFTTPLNLDAVSFTATSSNVTKNSADIAVSYNAKAEDLTWYGFISTDLTSPAATLIGAAVSGLSPEAWQTGGKTLSLTGLTPETDYRYIVTGINANGVYGNPTEVRFSTLTEAYDNTVFTVVATEVGTKAVTLKITHTGFDYFEYNGFLTTDFTSDVANVTLPANVDVNLMKGLEKEVVVEDLLPNTQYRYVVVGRYNGNEYGTRGEVIFTTADPAVHADYEDFLGTWTMQSGTKYDFTVEPKVAGQTYIVSGLNGSETAKYGVGTPLKVEGVYADGKFTIAIQTISEPYVDPEDNKTYTDTFCGMYTASNGSNYYDKTPGQVVVIFALMDDGTIELRPGKTTDGYDYYAMRYFQVPASGSAYAQDNYATNIPNTAKPAVEASAAYNKWLGNWTIGGVAFTIAKAEADVSYRMTGFYSSSYYGEVAFDSATGNIVYNHQVMDYTVNTSAGATYQMYTTGINSLNYVAVRDASDPSLAIFSLNSAGTSGTVTGVTYNHSEGQTTVTEIGLLGYNPNPTSGDSPWTRWTGFNYLTLPCDIVKGSASSVQTAPSYLSVPGLGVQSLNIRLSKEADKAVSRN